MIDTVILRIENKNDFQINDPGLFVPEFRMRNFRDISPAERKDKTQRPYLNKFVLKAPKKEYVRPRAEIYEKLNRTGDDLIYDLKIEFSTPKMILGNSLEEISESDFENVVAILQERLREMGICIKQSELRRSRISKIHFAKNIILPKEMKMQKILSDLSKADDGNDITRATHTNTSESLHFYLGIREQVFYEKISDMKKPKDRRKDKELPDSEKEMADLYNLDNREIFRYEYRLKNSNNLRSVINAALGRKYEEPILFQDVFNENLWKKLINQSWSKIINRDGTQLALKFSSKKEKIEIFRDMLIASSKNNNAHSMNKALISYGLANLANDYGFPQIRREFNKIWSDKACGNRFQDKAKEANELLSDLALPDEIGFIDREMKKFERITKRLLENIV